jgi:hypothetical protein
MQNKYFGDIHDFYKYFLLKNISKYKSLGIHWCLIPDDNKSDGNKILTDKENKKCLELFDILKQGKEINNIKQYFSKNVSYYDNLLLIVIKKMNMKKKHLKN